MAKNIPVSLHIDFANHLLLDTRDFLDADEIREIIFKAKIAGVVAINWRTEGIGGKMYPSYEYRTLAEYNQDDAISPSEGSWAFPASYNASKYFILSKKMEKLLDSYDPIEVASHAAREQGLIFNLYICPFDQYWPGFIGSVMEEFPYARWSSRDGEMALPLISLAWPEVRKNLVSQYLELMKYDFDGIYVYSTSHAWYGFPEAPEEEYFGYEKPVTDDFYELYGVNIRKNKNFDHYAWHTLKGAYFTAFLKELNVMLVENEKKMIVGTMLGDYNLFYRWAQPRQLSARYRLDWKEITNWGNIALSIGDQSDIWTNSIWQNHPDMPIASGLKPYELIDSFYGPVKKRNFDLYVFRGIHCKHDMAEEMRQVQDAWGKFSANGLILREAAELHCHEDNWHLLQALCE